MAMGYPPSFTANLVLNYRSPIRKDSFSILKAKVDKFEGRKLFMSATIEDALTGRLQVESTTLFINSIILTSAVNAITSDVIYIDQSTYRCCVTAEHNSNYAI